MEDKYFKCICINNDRIGGYRDAKKYWSLFRIYRATQGPGNSPSKLYKIERNEGPPFTFYESEFHAGFVKVSD